jgi:thioredoxin reductase (NADPH)
MIIGAGPAGMASAIYLHRAGWNPLLLERAKPGGLLGNANLVENYPGFPGGIKGHELVKLFKKQLDFLGVGVTSAEVKRVSVVRRTFRANTRSGIFSSRSLILATGTRPKRFLLPGSARLVGKRLFSEIVEMPLSKVSGKRTLIIGGGDAAFDYGINLAERGANVTIVARSEPTCLSLLRARAEASGVDVRIGPTADRLRLTDEEVLVGFHNGIVRSELRTDYVLTACGREPNLDVLDESLRSRIGRGDRIPETAVPGLFMAGDVVRGRHRQTAIAAGDGLCAAMMADEFLRETEVRK